MSCRQQLVLWKSCGAVQLLRMTKPLLRLQYPCYCLPGEASEAEALAQQLRQHLQRQLQ